jgi:hypothetical protein
VAFLFHAPGLFVFYRERIPRRLWLGNAVAVAVTLVAAGLAWQRWGGIGALAAWGGGHLLWGGYLALAL